MKVVYVTPYPKSFPSGKGLAFASLYSFMFYFYLYSSTG